MRTRYLSLLISLFLATSVLAQTDEDELAARIKSKVSEMGLKFTTTDSGNYKFAFSMEQDRSQLVFVAKNPSLYLTTGYIRVFTPVMKFASQNQIPQKTMVDLMNKNGVYKLGWFELVTADDGSSVVYFSHKAPITATAVNLYALIMDVAKIGDKIEETYTAKDDY